MRKAAHDSAGPRNCQCRPIMPSAARCSRQPHSNENSIEEKIPRRRETRQGEQEIAGLAAGYRERAAVEASPTGARQESCARSEGQARKISARDARRSVACGRSLRPTAAARRVVLHGGKNRWTRSARDGSSRSARRARGAALRASDSKPRGDPQISCGPRRQLLKVEALALGLGLTHERDVEALTKRLGAMLRDGQLLQNRRGGYGVAQQARSDSGHDHRQCGRLRLPAPGCGRRRSIYFARRRCARCCTAIACC